MATSQHARETEPTAAFILGNARTFLPAPLTREDRNYPDHHLHMVAISVELALKAALLAAGESDYSNRVFIGHDLAEAADWAADRGLHIRREVRKIIGILHPYYMQGGFHRGRRRRWPRLALKARPIAAALIADVGQAIETETLRPWSGPPKAGLASTLSILFLAAYLPSVRELFFARETVFDPQDRWIVRAIGRLPIAARGVYLMSCRARLSYPTIARLTFMPVRRVRAQLAGSLLALRDEDIASGEPSCERGSQESLRRRDRPDHLPMADN